MTDDGYDAPTLDWSAASVDDGRLTVPLTGEVPAGWTKRVKRVTERLERPGSGWDRVRVTKKELRVDDVSPGSEQDLHHFLESVVLQANASLRDDAEESDDARSEEDQAMTDAFRAFAPVNDRS